LAEHTTLSSLFASFCSSSQIRQDIFLFSEQYFFRGKLNFLNKKSKKNKMKAMLFLLESVQASDPPHGPSGPTDTLPEEEIPGKKGLEPFRRTNSR
jgi:hypothetical protein